jgi:glycosyltransferase involved in cell wall biosynthesis
MAAAIVANRRWWRQVSKFICVSPVVNRALASIGIPQERIVIKPNATSDSEFVPADITGRRLLFVGRLSPEKGIALLLEAWADALVPEESELLVAGTGPLESLVRERSLEDSRIRYLGNVSSQPLVDLRRSTRASAVLPLSDEAFGLTAIESLAAGRPVIATGAGALAEIIDDSVGWSVGSTKEELSWAISQALSDNHSVIVRGAEARRRWEERYSPVVTCQQLLSVYGSVSR